MLIILVESRSSIVISLNQQYNILQQQLIFLLLSYSLIIEQYYQHPQRKWVFIGNNQESMLSTTHPLNHIMLLLNKRVLTPLPNHCMIILIIRCDSFYDVTRDLKNAKKGTSLGRGNKTTFGDKYGFPSPLHYQVKSTFDQDTKNGKGIKLSLGR